MLGPLEELNYVTLKLAGFSLKSYLMKEEDEDKKIGYPFIAIMSWKCYLSKPANMYAYKDGDGSYEITGYDLLDNGCSFPNTYKTYPRLEYTAAKKIIN